MDRHNDAHRASRVDLEAALGDTACSPSAETVGENPVSAGPLWTRSPTANVLAKLGLLTSSLAVIGAASLLALIAR